ncbi:MAG: PorT family protein [Puniceicoccales bacterium]|nr:PorT family protein [Puniceicoccales bacterium]
MNTKTVLLAAAAVALPVCSPLSAVEETESAYEMQSLEGSQFFEIAPSVLFSTSNDKFSSWTHAAPNVPEAKVSAGHALYGVMLSGGYYPFARNRVSVDAGLFIGSYSDTFRAAPYDDGVQVEYWSLTRKTLSHVNIPVLVTWAYEYEIGADFHLRAGPSFGLTLVGIHQRWEDYRSDNFNNNVHTGSSTTGAPVPPDKTDFSVVLTYGLTVGFTWDATESFYVDGSYKFLGSTGFKAGDQKRGGSYAHQLGLAFGWRY